MCQQGVLATANLTVATEELISSHWNSDILPPHCGQTRLMIDEMMPAFDSAGSMSIILITLSYSKV
jgi:hypothetical protein